MGIAGVFAVVVDIVKSRSCLNAKKAWRFIVANMAQTILTWGYYLDAIDNIRKKQQNR